MELKKLLRDWIRDRAPGYLVDLDKRALSAYGMKFLDLFLSSPSKAYKLLVEKYGSEETADFAMLTLILAPIAYKAGFVGLEEELLEIIKRGDDEAFFKKLEEYLS